jgi:hypothetical protein
MGWRLCGGDLMVSLDTTITNFNRLLSAVCVYSLMTVPVKWIMREIQDYWHRRATVITC